MTLNNNTNPTLLPQINLNEIHGVIDKLFPTNDNHSVDLKNELNIMNQQKQINQQTSTNISFTPFPSSLNEKQKNLQRMHQLQKKYKLAQPSFPERVISPIELFPMKIPNKQSQTSVEMKFIDQDNSLLFQDIQPPKSLNSLKQMNDFNPINNINNLIQMEIPKPMKLNGLNDIKYDNEMKVKENEIDRQKAYKRKSQLNRMKLIDYLLFSLVYLNNDLTILLSRTKKQSTIMRNKFRIERIELDDMVFYDYRLNYGIEKDNDNRFVIQYDENSLPIDVPDTQGELLLNEDKKNRAGRKEIEIMHILYDLLMKSLECGRPEEQQMAKEIKRKYRNKVNKYNIEGKDYLSAFQIDYLPIFRNGIFIGKKTADDCYEQECSVIYEWMEKNITQEKNDYVIIGNKSDSMMKAIQQRVEKRTCPEYKMDVIDVETFLNDIENETVKQFSIKKIQQPMTKREMKRKDKIPIENAIDYFKGSWKVEED